MWKKKFFYAPVNSDFRDVGCSSFPTERVSFGLHLLLEQPLPNPCTEQEEEAAVDDRAHPGDQGSHVQVTFSSSELVLVLRDLEEFDAPENGLAECLEEDGADSCNTAAFISVI